MQRNTSILENLGEMGKFLKKTDINILNEIENLNNPLFFNFSTCIKKYHKPSRE